MADWVDASLPVVHVRTLGGFDLTVADGVTARAALVQPKRVALLAYLAVGKPGRFHRRDSLLAMFWPELDDVHARGALSQALTHLRQTLGAETVVTRGFDEVGLDAERVWCDAMAFEENLVAGNEGAALELYAGELLDGLFVSDARPFERWLDAERSRLHELARAAVTRLAARCDSEGDVGGALRWARHALRLDPLDERAIRHVVELLDRMGARADAIREYDSFASRLREELDVEPSPESRAVVEAIRLRNVAGPVPTPLTREYHAAESSVDGTDAVAPAAPGVRVSALRAQRWRTVATVAGVGLVLLAVAAIRPLTRATPQRVEAGRIVVLPFENLTGDTTLDPLGRIAADWIGHGLALSQIVDVVPGFEAAERLQAVPRLASDDPANRTQRVARSLGAGTAVVGSYHRTGNVLRFQSQLIDVGGSRVIRAVEEVSGSLSDPIAAIDELRRRTLGVVGFQFDARISPELFNGVRPPSYEAYLAFAAGEQHRDRWEWRKALEQFRRAYALDTTFTTALFLSVIQHLNLREFAAADSLTRILATSLDRLTRLERQLLEWAEARVRGDREGALTAARGLLRYSDAYRGQVALDALDANRPRLAIEVLEGQSGARLQTDRSASWELAFSRRLTEAQHRLGEYSRELTEAQDSRGRNPAVAEPVLWEMRAMVGLGRVEDALQRLEQAVRTSGAEWPSGEIMLRAADELRAHGFASQSRAILHRTLAWYRSLPDSEAMLPRHRRHRAAALLRADSARAALTAFRAMAAEFPQDPYYGASAAVALARLGDRRAASVLQRELKETAPYQYGHHLYEQARIAAALGNTEEAIDLLKRALGKGFRLAMVGGIGGSVEAPDGRPHLDQSFHHLTEHREFVQLVRGTH